MRLATYWYWARWTLALAVAVPVVSGLLNAVLSSLLALVSGKPVPWVVSTIVESFTLGVWDVCRRLAPYWFPLAGPLVALVMYLRSRPGFLRQLADDQSPEPAGPPPPPSRWDPVVEWLALTIPSLVAIAVVGYLVGQLGALITCPWPIGTVRIRKAMECKDQWGHLTWQFVTYGLAFLGPLAGLGWYFVLRHHYRQVARVETIQVASEGESR